MGSNCTGISFWAAEAPNCNCATYTDSGIIGADGMYDHDGACIRYETGGGEHLIETWLGPGKCATADGTAPSTTAQHYTLSECKQACKQGMCSGISYIMGESDCYLYDGTADLTHSTYSGGSDIGLGACIKLSFPAGSSVSAGSRSRAGRMIVEESATLGGHAHRVTTIVGALGGFIALVALAAAVRSQRFKRALATGRSNDYDNNHVALMDDPSDV